MHRRPAADGDAPAATGRGRRDLRRQAEYLQRYQADWLPWLAQHKATWHCADRRLAGDVAGVVGTVDGDGADAVRCGRCDLRAAYGRAGAPGTLSVAIDFPNRQVREWAGEPHSFRFVIQRELVETVTAQRSNDWSNALFLSCRFRAWREGSFNEYLYNFFKSLSVERMRRAEAEAVRKIDPDRDELADEEFETRRLHRRAHLPASPSRPEGVRRDRRRRVRLHDARLALRPRYRHLSQRRRSSATCPSRVSSCRSVALQVSVDQVSSRAPTRVCAAGSGCCPR